MTSSYMATKRGMIRLIISAYNASVDPFIFHRICRELDEEWEKWKAAAAHSEEEMKQEGIIERHVAVCPHCCPVIVAWRMTHDP